MGADNGRERSPVISPALVIGYVRSAHDRRVQRAAREGMYDIRGFGAKRRVPHFDDLLFLGASVSRYPLEGYRERCATDVTSAVGSLGADRARDPMTIAGMSFGALSATPRRRSAAVPQRSAPRPPPATAE